MVAARGPQAGGVLPLERTDAVTVAELYDEVAAALSRAFPRGRPVWVRGEIHSFTDRTGHCYLDLVDPDTGRGRDVPVLRVKCWRSTWLRLRAELAEQGLVLEPGMVVTLLGRIDLYRPRAELGFVVDAIDVSALLGRLAARRAALLKALEAEGLLRRNAGLPAPVLPLRVGLVASPGSEGYRDCTGQLVASGFGFQVLVARATVQGAGAPAALSRAVRGLATARCDLVLVVRGGGARGDLAAFDSEPVARAVATCPVPVWTGIGHTGDQAVTDLVAHRSFVTPTECGQAVVQTVGGAWGRVAEAAAVVARRATGVLGDALGRDEAARRRLVLCTRGQLDRHRDRLDARGRRLSERARRETAEAARAVTARSARLASLAPAQLDRLAERTAGSRRLLAAYDVERQLERGYTLTLDHRGRVLRSADAAAVGAAIRTRFADGTVTSTVTGRADDQPEGGT